MRTEDRIEDEKWNHDCNRNEIFYDKYEYLTVEEILPPYQIRMIELAKFIYSLLGKALEKQTKKEFDALKSLKLFNKINELKHIISTKSGDWFGSW